MIASLVPGQWCYPRMRFVLSWTETVHKKWEFHYRHWKIPFQSLSLCYNTVQPPKPLAVLTCFYPSFQLRFIIAYPNHTHSSAATTPRCLCYDLFMIFQIPNNIILVMANDRFANSTLQLLIQPKVWHPVPRCDNARMIASSDWDRHKPALTPLRHNSQHKVLSHPQGLMLDNLRFLSNALVTNRTFGKTTSNDFDKSSICLSAYAASSTKTASPSSAHNTGIYLNQNVDLRLLLVPWNWASLKLKQYHAQG